MNHHNKHFQQIRTIISGREGAEVYGSPIQNYMEDKSILNKNPQEVQDYLDDHHRYPIITRQTQEHTNGRKKKPIWQWVLDFVIWALCIVALVWVLAGTSGIKEYVGWESSQPYEVNDTIQYN